MAKKKNIKDESAPNEEILVDSVEETEIIEEVKQVKNIKPKLKEEVCNVLYVKDKMFAISFQGNGISIHTEHLIDKEKIKDFIIVKYEGEIGKSNFKLYPVYE